MKEDKKTLNMNTEVNTDNINNHPPRNISPQKTIRTAPYTSTTSYINENDDQNYNYIENKMIDTIDSIELSRQQAVKRVTERLKEDNKKAIIDKENEEQRLAVVQIVNERKAAELHRKTLERIAQRNDMNRATQLQQMEIEEEQKRRNYASSLKADERLLKMDELRKHTLNR